jgi:GT2 family glycosyltransferase
MSGTVQVRQSVIVSTRGRGAAVVDTIRSLLESTVGDLEVVVVDQSSEATTEAAVGPLLADGRLRYVRSHRVGTSRGRNEAASLTTGPLIMITDDDCVVPPGWIEAMAAQFVDERVGLVFCSVVAAPAPADQLGHTPQVEFARTTTIEEFAEALRLGRTGLPLGAGMAVRRTTFEQLGGFDEMLGPGARFGAAEDSDLSWRALLSGWSIVHLADVAVVHHGFRDLDQLRELVKRDFFGVGGTAAKYLRARSGRTRRAAAAFVGWTLWHYGVVLIYEQVRLRQRPTGLRRPYLLIRGLLAGLGTPMDRSQLIYEAEGKDRDERGSDVGGLG